MVRVASGHLSRERWTEELDQFFNISSQWWAYARKNRRDCAKYSAPPAETHQHHAERCGHRELVSILMKNFEISNNFIFKYLHNKCTELDSHWMCACVIIKVANMLWGVPSIIAYLEIELRNIHILIYTSPYFLVGFLHGLQRSLPSLFPSFPSPLSLPWK